MTQEERDAVVKKLYREYWDANEALAVLEASCVEITGSSSITTWEGFLVFSHSGLRLFETDYVREVVAKYHAAKEHKEALRKRLIELGQPDPDPEEKALMRLWVGTQYK
jgi:hypothetical protein